MANLRANKITSTEVFETTGSVQFDGGSSHLRLANTVDFDFATGNFTIEMWFYQTSNASRQDLTGNYVGASNGWGVGTNYDNTNDIIFYHGNTIIINTSTIYSLNTWNHLSVCRDSGTLRLFMNGNLITSVSDTTNISSTRDLRIGGVPTSLDTFQLPFQGHISNLRILKGTALYTKNFTPPTRELTVIPNTVLLCCQSTTRANEERTGKTITVNGNAVANELTSGLLTDRVKSGGDSAISGSVEFDGNDYLLESTGAEGFNGGLGDWTVEAWMYCTDASQSDTLLNGLTSSTDRFYIQFIGQTLYVGDFIINNIAIGGVKQVNSWFHIAVTKSSSTYRAFINGILIGSSTSALANSPLTSLQIGHRASQNYYAKGFISNLRIIKGTALYTQNFIPPTRELKRLPGTVLLCCKNSSDPTAEETGKTITPFGSLVYNSPELVNDGTFNSASSWPSAAADWSISGGRATINSANSGYDFLGILTNRTINGQLYELRFDISSWTAGRLELAQSDSSNIGVTVSGNGPYAFRFRYTGPTNGNVSLFSYTDTTASFALDNLSLKQVASVPSPPFTPPVGFDRIVTFDGVTKINTPNYFYLPTGNTEKREPNQVNSSYGTRGLTGGGYNGSVWTNSIQYITIATLGNAIDFGDLTQSRTYVSALASSTRAVFGTGESNNTLDYVTISSTGNASDFGDSTSGRRDSAGCSSSTRGLFGGGQGTNIIDYITIASTGNAQDFGDLTQGRFFLGACSSPVRGVFAGGDTGSPAAIKNINYVTIATTGNAITFGDLTVSRSTLQGCSNTIKGLFGGGYTIPASTNIVDYITISNTGSAYDFGDLITSRGLGASMSSSTRGIFAGWPNNSIEYISIISQGNALDFGDTISTAQGGCSNGHGGLG